MLRMRRMVQVPASHLSQLGTPLFSLLWGKTWVSFRFCR